VDTCVHRDDCSYVYEYLCLYCVSKKTIDKSDKPVDLSFWFVEFCLNLFLNFVPPISFIDIRDFHKTGREQFLKQNQFLKPWPCFSPR
jgi:hypothetical protein